MSHPSFLRRFLAHPDHRPALFLGHWYSYGQLRELGERSAGWLREQGVQPGDRVAIQLDNGRDLVAAHLGCMALGAVRLPLNSHYQRAELAPILEDAGPTLVISRHPERFPEGLPCHGQVGTGAPVADWPVPPEDITGLLFTSGTTGRAKGVPQTYKMWESNLDALASCWEISPEVRLFLALPMFHTHGLVLGLHGMLLAGASAVVGERFDGQLPPEDVTDVYGVPTWYRRWLPAMGSHPEAFRRLRLMVSGSDGLPAAVSDEVFALTGQRLLERYGMTETVMIASNPFKGERRAGTVGQALPGVELRIEEGEIQVRGPSVFSGYRPRPDPGAFVDGWFRTGDAGSWDEAGYLRITGRKKDLVIVGGVNVSPAEVEELLRSVHGVAEIGCCGLSDPDLNEVVGAAVVLDGSRSEEEVRRALGHRAQEALSGLKRPRHYAFVEGLPRNAMGKLQRGRIPGEVFGRK
ncbi:MAG TPA: AMP-binding protein [Myxococcota bacterium]|nr:AMP-binding protein [Myxococcota bacterium]HND30302.1 AMP-binding protein [Myxococcota bacterium]